ncbi:fibroblast growth factor receptor 3-like [Actinia tenebrosa]|uniref:Fibroblast growth factor receptor 3-like n=1 Tax=Actinia tenebrosa TaxID=6105 RepID=A0A6P8IMR7_ACTTE|nr:fibroblast growth factor receptor 3-like [Actinia tenebrosa]
MGSTMVSEARHWINSLMLVVLTMATLTRWCSCSGAAPYHCSQLIDKENVSTHKPGPPVFDDMYATQTEVKSWSTTQSNSLRCCVTAKPDPEIIWYRNGELLSSRNYRIVIQSNGQVVTINDIRKADEGNYTCIAKNAYGNISHSFLVKVTSLFVLQKPVVILQPSPWKTFVGNNISISCTIMKSARSPFVMWFHWVKNSIKFCRGNRYHITKIKKKEKGTWLSTLTISNVTMDDQGNYTCTAKNGAGSGQAAHQNGTLIVLELKPKTSHQHEDNTFFSKNPVFLGVVIAVGVSLLIILLVSILWRRKKSRSDHGTHFPINDQQSFSKPDDNPLLLHADDMHIEIPVENLQLLMHAPGAGNDSDLDFDVFVSYSSLDRDFVKNCLYAELTTTHSVCIDFKDFEAGLFITDNIANSVFRSRKTLLVVTRNFLKGVWTFFEMQLAQGRLAEGHDVLILVLVENIPVHELPKPLQHYRKTKTYLEYFNEDVRPHFWDRLRSAIGPSLRGRETEKDESV